MSGKVWSGFEVKYTICRDTPVEEYEGIYVKREDFACPPPGPPFSKARGLEGKMTSLLKEGIKTVGYMDTSVSMGGFAVSYFAKQLGMESVIFYPQYKDGVKHENLEDHIKKWNEFGATVVPLERPNRQKINFYKARRILKENWPNAFMLEQGFPYKEAIIETSKQVLQLPKSILSGSIVISVGSGVICSGVLQGLLEHDESAQTQIIGIFVSPKSKVLYEKRIRGRTDDIFSNVKLSLIDNNYEYTQVENIEVPFNCNKYYDAKAWHWLIDHRNELPQPIIFWNIGGEAGK